MATSSTLPAPRDETLPALTDWDRERIELIKKTVAQGATDAELQLFLYQARRLGLDPLLGQIKFVKRRRRTRDGRWEEVGTIMVGIDGLRVLAERTGKYAGQDEPEFEERGGPYPYACTVRVYRKDFPRPVAAKVFWAEYAPLDQDGQPMALWATKPRFMLSKTAEALALRKAFPADLSGVYIDEEFDQDAGRPPRRQPPRGAARPAQDRADTQNIDPDTGEVVDALPAPTPAPASTAPAQNRTATAPAPAPAPAAPAQNRTTTAPASDAAPALVTPKAPSPAPQAPPRRLSPEERHATQLLVSQAGRAEGFAGATPGQDWLERHFGTRSLDQLADRLDEVHERATAVLKAQERASAGPSPVDAARTTARMPLSEFRTLVHKAAVLQGVKSGTPGKSWLRERYGTDSLADLTDAQYEDAVRTAQEIVRAATARSGLATPSSIAALQAAFDRLGYDEAGRRGLIRVATNDRAETPEDMTETEIQALIDELGGPPPSSAAGASDADAA
jgi:phage recombination protein Bet